MSALLNHVKKVARDDTRLFFEPFVMIINWVRRKLGRTS